MSLSLSSVTVHGTPLYTWIMSLSGLSFAVSSVAVHSSPTVIDACIVDSLVVAVGLCMYAIVAVFC